jgi:hypothetical protein
MGKLKKIIPLIIILLFIMLYSINRINKSIFIIYPFDNTVFPPEFPSPVFKWMSKSDYNGNWEVEFKSDNGIFKLDTIVHRTSLSLSEYQWGKLKEASLRGDIKFKIKRSGKLGQKSITFSLSTDSVGAPILYRQMPIPFVVAEKELDSMNYVLLNVGSNKAPHTTMKGFKVCGNCHSFSIDGKYIGLDLDAGLRDKGGYFISQIDDTLLFNINNYMSWTKIEKRKTFGLFSKVSPNGRYIVTTINDRVVHKNFPYDETTNAFSQLFFPVNGYLAIYDRKTKQINELPGANIKDFVHSNATWTPDGQNIVFCRAKALPYEMDTTEINITEQQLVDEFVERKKTLKYDLYIIPFNNAKGGEAIPIKGASSNSRSNYFPAVSPDGKWIVFCQAENFMLLQPDSRLYIVPLEGGKARKLNCNLHLMNSWHAWSPNSKWIVFVSKGMSIYTDMFLSHIDEKGNASPPVLLEKARQYRKVANYPEFLNAKPDFKFDMVYDYVELTHIDRAIEKNDIENAKILYKRFKDQLPMIFDDDLYHIVWILQKIGLDKEKGYWEKRLSQK